MLRAALPARRGQEGRSPDALALWRGKRWRWSTWGALWLVFLVNVAGALWDRNGVTGRLVGGLLLGAFVVVFLLTVPLVVVRPPQDRLRWLPPALLLVLGAGLIPLAGEAALATDVYVVVVALMLLPPPTGIVCTAVLVAGAAAAAQWVPGWGDPVSVVLPMVTAAMAIYGLTSLVRRNQQLMSAREEIARLAVSEERLRFARDVHDLLGHSLTVVTVKTQLARRLLDSDPARAAAELAEVERLAREALHDVRATVSGYRGVTLAGELATARTALTGVGLTADLPADVDVVPAHLHEPFGWVVREGVTNVLRHAQRVTRCSVRMGESWLEVVDDGHPGWAANVPRRGAGNGLRGLQERVAEVGGRISAGRQPSGGYRLRVDVGVPAQRTVGG
ncbi:MAG: sensor histidine kinase [Motilibacteraceae bacterium]